MLITTTQIDTQDEFETTNKFWRMVELALEDLKKCFKLGITLNNDDWFHKSDGKVCAVCLGGAVLYGRYSLTDFREATNQVMWLRVDILDDLRRGKALTAIHRFYNEMNKATNARDFIADEEKRYSHEGQIEFAKEIMNVCKQHDI